MTDQPKVRLLSNHSNANTPDEDEAQQKALKNFFARRVTNQVRQVLEVWRIVGEKGWSYQWFDELVKCNLKLVRYAHHFEALEHQKIALKIAVLLNRIDSSDGPPSSDKLAELSELVMSLSHSALRKGDAATESQSITPRKPIYIVMADSKHANRLAKQLEFFGYRVQVYDSKSAFSEEMSNRYPSAIIADVDFGREPGQGLELIENTASVKEARIPVIFYSGEPSDIYTRVRAMRAGGVHFHNGTIETGRLIDQLEQVTYVTPAEPYQVLIVEDSKSQARHTEQILNNAGVITHVVSDPLEVLNAMDSFGPEIVIMDMYLPGFNGMELAHIIRQDEKYVSIPILYLSSEIDIDIQLLAMSRGGDEFLTKPVKAEHLVSVVRTRANRARALLALMVRDSLTGLLNHTRILQRLDADIMRARKVGVPLCFAMLDIDHFKKVNDTHGHSTGDRVIKNTALFLKQRLRKSDAIGRYGGEEFAVVLYNTTLEDARKTFDDLRDRFSQLRHSTGSTEINVTFSCGVAALTEDNADTITIQADEALYVAKNNGRNRIEVHTSED